MMIVPSSCSLVSYTVCPRGIDNFYTATLFIKWTIPLWHAVTLRCARIFGHRWCVRLRHGSWQKIPVFLYTRALCSEVQYNLKREVLKYLSFHIWLPPTSKVTVWNISVPVAQISLVWTWKRYIFGELYPSSTMYVAATHIPWPGLLVGRVGNDAGFVVQWVREGEGPCGEPGRLPTPQGGAEAREGDERIHELDL